MYNFEYYSSTYTYDANGNLFSDTSRGITRIEYNDLNLPTALYWGDGHRQTIEYDGRGVKLSVTYATATTDVLLGNGTYRRYRTDYVRRYGAGRVLRGDSVEMVMHPYGYYDGDGNIRYYLHDFQGNVTMVVDNEGEVLQHTRYYPYGEPIDVFAASEMVASSPTSDRNQPFLYGGKELERMHGLGEYDYGARRFQSHLPMWTTQDPCLEKYFPTSPYTYCAGNPIRFTDPTGCDADQIITSLQVIFSAIFYVLPEDLKLAQESADIINQQSGQYEVVLPATESEEEAVLEVKFDVQVEVINPETSQSTEDLNIKQKQKVFLNSNSTDHALTDPSNTNNNYFTTGQQEDVNYWSHEKRSGYTSNGFYTERLCGVSTNAPDKTQTGAHEMLHGLGSGHHPKGLMTEEANSIWRNNGITKGTISQLYNRGFQSMENQTKKPGKVNLINNSKFSNERLKSGKIRKKH